VSQAYDSSSKGSLIGPGLSFKGELVADEDLMIQGRVDGSIKHTGHLTVGQQGKVKANIEAKRITIEGTVEGDLKGSEAVNVHASAKVRGNIFSPSVTLNDGARFTGSIDMDSGKAASPNAGSGDKPSSFAAHAAQKQSA
jgi:cytoskeletal protein CcmA (bactofilin family)